SASRVTTLPCASTSTSSTCSAFGVSRRSPPSRSRVTIRRSTSTWQSSTRRRSAYGRIAPAPPPAAARGGVLEAGDADACARSRGRRGDIGRQRRTCNRRTHESLGGSLDRSGRPMRVPRIPVMREMHGPLPGLARASGAGHAHFRQIRRAGAMPSLYWYPPQTGGFSMKHFATILGATLLAAALPAAASSAAPLEECVQLSDAHRGTRANGNRQLLLRDGDAHYRVSFGRTCETLARSSRIYIATDG